MTRITTVILAVFTAAVAATDNFTVFFMVYSNNDCSGESSVFVNNLDCSTAPFQFTALRAYVPPEYRAVADNYAIETTYGPGCDIPNRTGYYGLEIPKDDSCVYAGTLDDGLAQSISVYEGEPY